MNAADKLKNIRVVLSRPSHPGNIGAAARAMKTMGLSALYLVNPRRFPDHEAETMASGARDVLAGARVCASLDEALAGTVLAVASSARPRELPVEVVTPREAARRLLEAARAHPAALVFGSETSGLSAAEVGKCRLLAYIPAGPEYSSLNLAAAVQVFAYELRMALPEKHQARRAGGAPAAHEEVEGFLAHLEQTLAAIGFLDPRQPKKLMRRLRRLFGRAQLEKEEINILRGILTAVNARRR